MTCTETQRYGVPRLRVGLGGLPRAVMNATKPTRQQTPVGQKKATAQRHCIGAWPLILDS